MNKTQACLLSLSMFGAALAGACSNPADNQPQAVVTEAKGTQIAAPVEATPATTVADTPAGTPAGTTAVAARQFAFTPESTIEWTGSKVTGKHDGGFTGFTGEINLVDGNIEASSVNVTIDVNSMFTDSDRLLGHLKSEDFFDAAQFGQATFASTGIVQHGDHYMVSGDLTLRGVTKNITFPATIAVEGDTIHAHSTFALKRFDFDIKFAGKSDDLIREDVVIKLNIVAAPKA